MKAAVVILARNDSIRLPRKSMRRIAGKPVLQHQIERLATSRHASQLILATTHLPSDDELCRLAQAAGIDCLRGDPEDVVRRMVQVADRYSLDFAAVVGGDKLFCEGQLVDAEVTEYRRSRADYIRIANLPFDTSPFGVTSDALRRVMEIKAGSTDGWERYLYHTGEFRVSYIPASDPALEAPHLRLELDYPEDLELFTKVYDRLYRDGRQPPLRDVVRLLTVDDPDLAQINKSADSKWRNNRDQVPIRIRDGNDGS